MTCIWKHPCFSPCVVVSNLTTLETWQQNNDRTNNDLENILHIHSFNTFSLLLSRIWHGMNNKHPLLDYYELSFHDWIPFNVHSLHSSTYSTWTTKHPQLMSSTPHLFVCVFLLNFLLLWLRIWQLDNINQMFFYPATWPPFICVFIIICFSSHLSFIFISNVLSWNRKRKMSWRIIRKIMSLPNRLPIRG